MNTADSFLTKLWSHRTIRLISLSLAGSLLLLIIPRIIFWVLTLNEKLPKEAALLFAFSIYVAAVGTYSTSAPNKKEKITRLVSLMLIPLLLGACWTFYALTSLPR